MISIILPSWNRQQDLLRSIENIRATTQGIEVELVIVLNDSDKDSRDAAKKLEGLLIVIMPKDCPNGRPHRAWQAGYTASSGKWVVQTADDVLFDPGWLVAALNHPNKGFIALWEPHWGTMLPSMFMATREYIDTVMGGYFGLTYYYSQWSDNEILYRSKNSGRHTCCQGASFVHLNRGLTSQPKDEYAKMVDGRYGGDGAIFQARKAAGFPNDWPEV